MLQSETSPSRIPHYESERFVQSALDALSAHIAILDETGVIIAVNSAWCQFADDNGFKDPDYGIGTNYLIVCDGSSGRNSKESSIVSVGIRDVMRHNRNDFSLEYPCHSRDQKRWFVMHVTRFDWQGSLRYIIAHQNVTELKRVHIELEESRTQIQTILDNVINGIITLDENGFIESANPAATDLFGYKLFEMHGMAIGLLMAEPNRSAETQTLLAQLEASTDHEMIGQRIDGSIFPMYLAISHARLGGRWIFTAIIQDVTERKRMEAEILENQKLNLALEKERQLRELKNRFITMMSHELRTPLASILLSSDMLKVYGDKVSQEEKLLYLNNIHTQVDHVTEMIKDVQTISKSESQSNMFIPEVVDLVLYCRDIVDEFNLIHHKSHRLLFDSVREKILTMIDPKLMRQVITNLLSNAIKYSPEGSEVLVEIRNGGLQARIIVSDEGIGVPEDDLAALFEPFHRAVNVENYPGTGLGLAIAKQATELHGGEISVESELGKGTTVTIRLPIVME